MPITSMHGPPAAWLCARRHGVFACPTATRFAAATLAQARGPAHTQGQPPTLAHAPTVFDRHNAAIRRIGVNRFGNGPNREWANLSGNLLRCDRPVLRSLVEIYATAFACIDRRNAMLRCASLRLRTSAEALSEWAAMGCMTAGGEEGFLGDSTCRGRSTRPSACHGAL